LYPTDPGLTMVRSLQGFGQAAAPLLTLQWTAVARCGSWLTPPEAVSFWPYLPICRQFWRICRRLRRQTP